MEPELEVLSVYRDYGVIPKDSRTDNFNRTPEGAKSYQAVRAGDVVVNRMKAWQGSLGVSGYDGLVSPDYEVLAPTSDELDPRFAHLLLRSAPLIDEYGIRSTGIRPSQWRLYWEQLRTISVPVPPLAEQRAIADYLDRETARIDTLIDEQQLLIEMLRERRSALITQVATTGVDDAPLVDSGNIYLGHVPAHWTVSRLSREMEINGGQVDPRTEPWSDMVLVAPNHIEPGTGRIIGRQSAREQAADSGKYVAAAGQVLYSKIRPALNKVAVAPEDCLTSADMYAMSSTHGDDHRFVVYFMLAKPFHTFATLASLRVKMPKVNREELGGAPFLRPPLDEQRRIVRFLDAETAKVDALIVEAERFIELSRERRAALITAAVTGQIDVRDEVA
ncbi:restriction endonuclease subunit S [Nocardioides sp. Iso805N]|uniref:restriction endonuclease subunit S n=1 Tax=Nocardioides sp. Iso805N TaxID=1283287 RepID=UPI000360483B|nr:restriction endonuclease subunit S [Nocardioides sp. Iso805N]